MSANLNTAFHKVLCKYSGTIDDRRMTFIQRFFTDRDGTLDDLEHYILSDLGYTGTLNDMWSDYLKSFGGTLHSKGDYLPNTFYGNYHSQYTVFVVDGSSGDYSYNEMARYTKNGVRPAFAVDGSENLYALEG